MLIAASAIAVSIYAYGYAAERRDAYAPETFAPIVPGTAEGETGLGSEAAPLMDFGPLVAEGPDIRAWIALDGTKIDYPVVQGEDNSRYLNRTPKGDKAKQGSIFLDYRCKSDFSSFVSVVYGHNMANGSMFKGLIPFKGKSYFDEHASGTLYTPAQTYALEIFAVAVVPSDSEAYRFALVTPAERKDYQETIRQASTHYRDIGLGTNDKILILSTCSYEFEDARTVVAARLRPI